MASRPNRSFEKKPTQRRSRGDRAARAAPTPKLQVDNAPSTGTRSCGECLMERVEAVKLDPNGCCPKCGTDYGRES